MTKNEYLTKLRRALRRVKTEERQKSLAYFSEVIDDRMEDGVPEETAISELESIEAAASRIIAEAEAQGQLKPRRSVWEIILIVLGFPVWFPLLLTVAVVVLVMYGLVWILIGVMFAVCLSLVIGGTASIFALFFSGGLAPAAACLGVGLVCVGLGIALCVPSVFFARAYAKATPVLWNKLKLRKDGKTNEQQN